MSEEKRLLPERRGMVSGGSLQVMRRRSKSSPSNGTCFHLEPFGTMQALVWAWSAEDPPPSRCLLGRGTGRPPWGQQPFRARLARRWLMSSGGATTVRLVDGGWWECDVHGVSQPQGCFQPGVHHNKSRKSKSHHTPVPVTKTLRQLSSAQERFPRASTCPWDSRTPAVSITWLSDRTRDLLLDPRPWRNPQGRPSTSY